VWQSSPFGATAFLRRFYKIVSAFHFFRFDTTIFFTEQGRQPCVQPPNMEGQVPVFISPRNGVTQLYPQALGSLFVVFHDSAWLRWRYSNPPPHAEFNTEIVYSLRKSGRNECKMGRFIYFSMCYLRR
jgi:hypothetical protein